MSHLVQGTAQQTLYAVTFYAITAHEYVDFYDSPAKNVSFNKTLLSLRFTP
jgi:hypothetical protein